MTFVFLPNKIELIKSIEVDWVRLVWLFSVTMSTSGQKAHLDAPSSYHVVSSRHFANTSCQLVVSSCCLVLSSFLLASIDSFVLQLVRRVDRQLVAWFGFLRFVTPGIISSADRELKDSRCSWMFQTCIRMSRSASELVRDIFEFFDLFFKGKEIIMRKYYFLKK